MRSPPAREAVAHPPRCLPEACARRNMHTQVAAALAGDKHVHVMDSTRVRASGGKRLVVAARTEARGRERPFL